MIATRTTSPEETRERILGAAREVIARKGKRGATTREIADVAGVNEATLFRHFGSKSALVIAVAQRFCGIVELRDVVAQLHGPIEEDLLAIGRVMYERMESQKDIIRWSIVDPDYDRDLFSSTAWRPQLAIHEVVVDVMDRYTREGALTGDPRELALFFMGTVLTHVLAREKFPGAQLSGNSDEALRFYINIFLNGTKRRG